MCYLKHTCLYIGCCLFTIFAYCHQGGHYHYAQELNNWQLNNGLLIKGNFLAGNKQSITLEQLNGATITLPIHDLSSQYQLLARYKVKKLQSFNELLPRLTTSINKSYYLSFIMQLFIIAIGILFIGFTLYKIRKQYNKYYITMATCLFSFFCYSFNNSGKEKLSKTNPSFIDAAFAPYKPAVQTSWDNTNFYVSSNGLPSHNMMVGIKSWQQQVPLPQNYIGDNQWSIPLQPLYAEKPINTKNNFMRGAIALAVNGVPIFNPLNNRGEDAYAVGELDNWGGHCGRADDYHYHIAPMHLQAKNNLPIAFALDGFSVYGSKEPDGSDMKPLDECHGHIIDNGQYHYHGTNTYPYLIAAMRGRVNIDDSKQAPENQITPQPNCKPVRPPQTPLPGAIIQNFEPLGSNGYLLTYDLSSKKAYLKYFWTNNGEYQFSFIDINGNNTQATYKKRNK